MAQAIDWETAISKTRPQVEMEGVLKYITGLGNEI